MGGLNYNYQNAMEQSEKDRQHIRQLLARLERISADSIWAHRASGMRGSLLRLLDEINTGGTNYQTRLAEATSACYTILTRAAREIPDTSTNTQKK